jgi:hypothetical protein
MRRQDVRIQLYWDGRTETFGKVAQRVAKEMKRCCEWGTGRHTTECMS